MNVVLAAKGTDGDVLPFLGVGAALRQRGHRVTLVTHCRYAPMAEVAGLDVVALDTPEAYQQYLADLAILSDPTRTPRDVLRYARRHAVIAEQEFFREYRLLEEGHVPGNTVFVGRYRAPYILMVAERVSAPIAWLMTTPSDLTLPITQPLQDAALTRSINALRAHVTLPPVASWNAWMGRPRRSIAQWPCQFGDDRLDRQPGTVPVGFLLGDQYSTATIPRAVQELLDGPTPPILITGGTSMMLSRRFYTAGAAACALLGYPAILVTQHRDHVPARLPAGILWTESLPFARVMPRVSAVIHHGGMGTVGRALLAGIPQVALAHGLDRPDNAARVRRLGAGEHLPLSHWDPQPVAAALQRVTTDEVIRGRCLDIARRLQATDAADVACRLIEGVFTNRHSEARPGGAGTARADSVE